MSGGGGGAPPAKRACPAGGGSAAPGGELCLPRDGEEREAVREGRRVRYGSSLRLIAAATQLLNSSEEFAASRPEADWSKFQAHGWKLFYAAAVADEAPSGGGGEVVSALRAIVDPSDDCPAGAGGPAFRVAIDYVHTAPPHQGAGHARRLVALVCELFRAFGANTYVLALELSCPWWLAQGFVLEEQEAAKRRLSLFSDCHLLRLPTNLPEPAHLPEGPAGDDEEGEEEEDEESGGDDGEPDAALQLALQQSISEQRPPPRPAGGAGGAGGAGDDDAELAAAIQLSLLQSQT